MFKIHQTEKKDNYLVVNGKRSYVIFPYGFFTNMYTHRFEIS